MTKGIKVALIASLLFNVSMVVGFMFYRNHVRSKVFKLAAVTAQAEVSISRSILSELESDPVNITALKEQLRKNIETALKQKVLWKQGAEK